jgi:hypothetical protein
MTEAEWLACSEPTPMLGRLQKAGLPRSKGGRRKLLLHGAACCRRVWGLLPDARSQRAVHALEQYADGAVGKAALEKARLAARKAVTAHERKNRGGAWRGWDTWMAQNAAAEMAARALAGGSVKVALKVSGLIRGAVYWTDLAAAEAAGMEYTDIIPIGKKALANGSLFACLALRELVNPFRPPARARSWRTSAVVASAQAAYDERLLPSGELDPSRLAVLADALEKAGGEGDLLNHLRMPGPHVRGCWAVDLVLGKE